MISYHWERTLTMTDLDVAGYNICTGNITAKIANIVLSMSDSEDSTVTYTSVSSPFEGRSGDISPGVDGPLVMPEDPYAYVIAAFQAPPSLDYVPGPEEPE
ncbi:hypothetical protein Tco_1515544 [Tanacetum coccineum]